MNIAPYIDHTLLKPTALFPDIIKLCNEALLNHFAAVCIPPPFVGKAKTMLAGSAVKVATVIGFPMGYPVTEAKIAEILSAIGDGADELDMVINLIHLKNQEWQYLAQEIDLIMPVIRENKKIVKVIIESGLLTREEIIGCCKLYGEAGVDFLKTSTGYAEKQATVETVALLRSHLPGFVRIKASGGIRTYDFAKALIDAGADRIGTSAGPGILAGAAGVSLES